MSSKMPKVNDAKIKSAHKYVVLAVTGALAMLVSGYAVFLIIKADTQTIASTTPRKCAVHIENDCIALELADTDEARVQGLSGRESMAMNAGMVFVFDAANEQCMWMKDMNFAIDMIWLNNDKQIVKIAEDVRPETYPETFCAKNSRYVIELNSGVADKAKLRVGQTLNL